MRINRIFCIGRNYAEHIRELGGAADDECVVFMKPASCAVPGGKPIRLPHDRGSVHHEAELVLMLDGGGSDITTGHALDHVSHFTLGLDLTLRDLQNQLKKKSAPWELSKAFDGAAPLGTWTKLSDQPLE